MSSRQESKKRAHQPSRLFFMRVGLAVVTRAQITSAIAKHRDGGVIDVYLVCDDVETHLLSTKTPATAKETIDAVVRLLNNEIEDPEFVRVVDLLWEKSLLETAQTSAPCNITPQARPGQPPPFQFGAGAR